MQLLLEVEAGISSSREAGALYWLQVLTQGCHIVKPFFQIAVDGLHGLVGGIMGR